MRPFPHDAVNVPAIAFAVCDEIVYWKLPQLLADGSVGDTDDVHTPTTFGELEDVEVGVVGGALPPAGDVDEGDSTLDECWKPHAPTLAAATRSARSESDRLVVMAYKPVRGHTFSCAPCGHFPTLPTVERRELIR